MAMNTFKMVKGKKIHVTFRSPKIKSFFMGLCDSAPKVGVDWAKFRELDKHGLFSDFTNEQLSMKIRHLRLREAGLCWYCGEQPATTGNGTCEICALKVKAANTSYVRAERMERNAK